MFAPRGTKESGGVLNDEFVVFDPSQAFVQYVIHYGSSSAVHSNVMTGANAAQAFRKVLMKPGRAVVFNDPLDSSYRYAEGHFLRMMNKYTLRDRFKQLFTGERRMETIVENGGDSIGYLGLTQNTGRIIVIDQASRFRAMKKQFLLL